MSEICEAFHCPPDVALRQDYALVMTILEQREFMDAKRALGQAQKESDKPTGAMADLVQQYMLEQHQAILAERRRKLSGEG